MKISARVLDGVYGRPAVGVRARIERLDDGTWAPVTSGESDVNGIFANWNDTTFKHCAHRIIFDSDLYFAELGMITVCPEVTVTIRGPGDAELCQVQVVLTPASYSAHVVASG